MVLDPNKLSQMSPSGLLNFLWANYKDYVIKAEGDPMPHISAFSIGGVVNLAEFWFSGGGHPAYDISVFDTDINKLSDTDAAITVLNGRQLFTVFKFGEATPCHDIITNDGLWNLAHRLFNGCEKQSIIQNKPQQRSDSLRAAIDAHMVTHKIMNNKRKQPNTK